MSSSVQLHPVLGAVCAAADRAYRDARRAHTREELASLVADGADGTPTMRIDVIVEEAIVEATETYGVNVLSEEAGLVDRGSALTVVVDPVDGSANAAAGVPVCAVSAALAVDHRFTEATTRLLGTDLTWSATTEDAGELRTTGRTALAGADISLLRPRPGTGAAWHRLAAVADRVRVLGCSTLDGALVAAGAVDVFVDPGGDIHRLVDLAAAAVLVPAAGGWVADVHGRPVELDVDLTRRWSGVVAASRDLAEAVVDAVLSAP